MKHFTKLLFLLSGSFCFAQTSLNLHTATYPSVYHTPLVKLSTMTCAKNEMKAVLSPKNEVLAEICAEPYSACRFQGSCTIEKENGEHFNISYYKYDAAANQSYFIRTEKRCSFGYGMGRLTNNTAASTCLIPYVSVSADPLERNVGDVIFLPSLVGTPLPDGGTHDGYLIVSDYTSDQIGSGSDHFAFFTGFQSKTDSRNPLIALGLTNPDNSYQFEVISGPKAEEIRKKKGFTIVKTFKYRFKAPRNPMLEGL